MASTERLLTVLKQELRSRKITYANVAIELDLSETSVKRLFAGSQMSLARMEAICRLVGWDWTDLIKAAEATKEHIDCLSESQEQVLSTDIELLLVAVSVLNGYTFADLVSQFNFTPEYCVQKLAQLDRLGILELQAKNRIKLRVSPNFHWRPRGPIQKFFLEHVLASYFDTDFMETDEKLVVANALLSQRSNLLIQQKLDKLVEEVNEAMRADADLPMDMRHGNTLVLALRRWRYPGFDALHKS